MIQTLAKFFTGIMQRWLPDAFLFAVLLTLVVFVSGVLFEQQSIMEMTQYWGNGLWDLLAFSMQMIFILVTGHALANSNVIKNLLHQIAKLATTPTKAVVLTTLVATIASWLNWGFGLVVGGIIARHIAQNNSKVHYPLLVAAAYSGFLVWHAGLSGSIPLKIATPGQDALGSLIANQAIPVSETLFSWPVIIIVLFLLVTLPLLNLLMMPNQDEVQPIQLKQNNASTAKETAQKNSTKQTPAEKMETSPVISMLLAGLGILFLINHFREGGGLGLNTINLLLLSLGLIFHVNTRNYLQALQEAIQSVTGIVLQFPLYAGIMGMMIHSGLASSLSQWFINHSTAETFSLLTFISAGIVNFFVPSGGGQWALQAPIVIPAAQSLGVPLNQVAMAVAFGDAWTNMIQPFWALPLLGIAGLKIKDIMGYCTVTLLWSGLVIGLGIFFLF